MITVTLSNIIYAEELEFGNSGDEVLAVTVRGHALFEDTNGDESAGYKKGENIICAAVSFAALTLLKSIKIIGDVDPQYSIERGLLQFSIDMKELDSKKKNVLKILLESFIIGMLDIKDKYRDSIEIKFV